MLTLPIKKKWFDMILSGEKTEEYREIKPYWTVRFKNIGLLNDEGEATGPALIKLRNGYSHGCREAMALFTIHIREGRPEWGAEPGKVYYVL